MATKLILEGNVQGVMCRYFCRENAKTLGLSGTASNMPDGTVNVLINSDDESVVNQYINLLRNNPHRITFYGKISNISFSKGVTFHKKGDYSF